MDKIRLMIVDVDSAHTMNICHRLSICHNIEIVATEMNGVQALESIRKLKPDIVLCDVQLPGIDGICLLKETHLMPEAPIFIFCTHFYSDHIIENAQRNGAVYFLYKPIDYHFLPDIIYECYTAIKTRQKKNNSPKIEKAAVMALETKRIHQILVDMGMPPRLIGCLYLIESVILIHENRILLSNLSKGLYAEIGAKMHTSPSCIERALRNAISIAYNRGVLSKYFSHRPTNKEFLEYLLHAAERMPHKPLIG